MELNEIKKVLYKEKPIAHRIYAGHHHFVYYCHCSIGKIDFHVPTSDMGELPFGETEQSQLLIRYIVL